MGHAKTKSNGKLIMEGMEMYKSKSAMKKHEKSEPMKMKMSEGEMKKMKKAKGKK